MKNQIRIVFLTLLLGLFYSTPSMAQIDSLSLSQTSKIKQRRNANKEWRHAARESHSQYFLKINYVNAFLETNVSTQLLGGILTANLSFEDQLNLPNKSSLITASFLGRITPNSGIYASYYGLNRSTSFSTNQEYIFLGDTIPSGVEGNAWFNNQMLSLGYLLSLVKRSDSFLGIYFNMFFMDIDAGLYSDYFEIDKQLEAILPFPNFGFVLSYELKEWLLLEGHVGFFAFKNHSLDESLYDFSINLTFKPYDWLGINLSYKEFNVKVLAPQNNVDVAVQYGFRGPAFGLVFSL